MERTTKRTLRILLALMLAVSALTVSALADSGPSPYLTVRVENPPAEGYCLDLLWEPGGPEETVAYDGMEWSYPEGSGSAPDPALLAALRAAVPEGWHACTAEGTPAPMYGDLVGRAGGHGTRVHSFHYAGLPEVCRVLVVTESGESWCSEPFTRRTMQSSVTVDWAAGTLETPAFWPSVLAQFLCTLIPTLVIEGALFALFRYRERRSWRCFLWVNLATQGGLAAFLAVKSLTEGVHWNFLVTFVPLEIGIFLVELALYFCYLKEGSRGKAFGYTLCANAGSALFGKWLLGPLWEWMMSL